MPESKKPWYKSTTIISSIITVLALIASKISEATGVPLEAGAEVQGAVQEWYFSALAVISTAVAIYGRIRAKTKITAKKES